jgi:hypothetical protein
MRKVAGASEARIQVLKIAQRMADQRSVIRRARAVPAVTAQGRLRHPALASIGSLPPAHN